MFSWVSHTFLFQKSLQWQNHKSLEDSSILLKVVSKSIDNETKKQRGGFLGMLLGTLGATLSGNNLAGKDVIRVALNVSKTGEKILQPGQNFWVHLFFS